MINEYEIRKFNQDLLEVLERIATALEKLTAGID
jgi:hypothetical protein